MLSPKELSLLEKQPLSVVSYHVRVLVKCGAIEIAGDRRVRGSIEHFYLPTDLVKGTPGFWQPSDWRAEAMGRRKDRKQPRPAALSAEPGSPCPGGLDAAFPQGEDGCVDLADARDPGKLRDGVCERDAAEASRLLLGHDGVGDGPCRISPPELGHLLAPAQPGGQVSAHAGAPDERAVEVEAGEAPETRRAGRFRHPCPSPGHPSPPRCWDIRSAYS